MRRGIVIVGMVIGLLLGCNNGLAEELAAEKRLGEIGRSAEGVFYSFIDLIAGTLGFTVKVDTNKSAVGDYFKGLASGVDKTVQALVEIGNKMQQPSGGDQKSVSVDSSNQEIENAKNTLTALKGHIEALKEIGDSSKVGEVGSSSQNGEAADMETLKSVYKALKGIVDTAVEAGVDKLKESKLTLSQALIGGTNPHNGAKILAAGANAGSDGDRAVAIVSAVNGEAILDSIVKSEDKVSTIGSPATVSTTELEFAKGGTTPGNLARTAAKASSVAGGIALCSLTKGGKLASHNGNKDGKAVQSAGITAVNKLLGAVEDIIKKTVKKVLEKAKGEIDKARDSKATI